MDTQRVNTITLVGGMNCYMHFPFVPPVYYFLVFLQLTGIDLVTGEIKQ